MPLPNNFNQWEFLQDIVRRDYNKAVNAYFKNTPSNDLSTNKSKLKQACTHHDDDSALETLIKMLFFEFSVGKAQSIQTPIYGIPVQEFQRNVKFKPQVRLYFKEPFNIETHDTSVTQVRGEITFRLSNETSDSISRAKAELLARAIKQHFANPIFTWEKGWYKCTYLDLDKGYDLRLLVKSEIEGKRVVKQILKVQNHTYNNNYFQFINHEKSYSTNPGTHRVYGSTVKKWRQRPRANLQFSYAQLLIHGRIKPVNLVDVGGRLRNVIEKV